MRGRGGSHGEDAALLAGLFIMFAALSSGTEPDSVVLAVIGALLAGIAMGVRLSRWL